MGFLQQLLREQDGQDVAEYAVMLAVVLGIGVANIHLVATNDSKT